MSGPVPPRSRVRVLEVLLGLSTLSTGIHNLHNLLRADLYPPIPVVFPTPLAYQVGVVLVWPALTIVGFLGLRWYRRGEVRRAAVALALYSDLGLSTVLHYIGGAPHLVPPFFVATIFTDLAAGLAVLVFAVRQLLDPPRPAPADA